MKNKVLIWLFILIFFSSCGVYDPLLTDIPLINCRNDLRVDGGRSLAETAGGTISYGLTNKLAIQVAASYCHDHKYYFQVAPGYYKTFEKHKIVEYYLGYGSGTGYAYSDPHPGHIEGKYQIYFAQADVGLRNLKFAHADMGLGLKTGILHSNLEDNSYYAISSTGTYIDNCLPVELHASMRFGTENIKICLKMAGCLIYKFKNREVRYPYTPLNFGLGLNFSLPINYKSGAKDKDVK